MAEGKPGELLVCKHCGKEFEAESWRENDGPCRDGGWYCVACIILDTCSCMPPEKKEKKE